MVLRASHHHRRAGFTLVEVLATIMLLAIVLPVAMRGVTISTQTASTARRRTEAAGFDAHLVKPTDPIHLQQVLASLRTR